MLSPQTATRDRLGPTSSIGSIEEAGRLLQKISSPSLGEAGSLPCPAIPENPERGVDAAVVGRPPNLAAAARQLPFMVDQPLRKENKE